MNKHWEKDKYKSSPELSRFCEENISVIIATLNEELTIKTVIDSCKPYCNEILVIDGHSSDKTKEIAAQCQANIYMDNRRGKGDALRVGISKAKGSIIVFIDADMSHDPADIPKLVSPIFHDNIDHVVGSRPKGGSDELHGDFNKFIRMIGSDIITLGINYRFNIRLTDSQNGFRAIKTSVARSLKLCEDITTIEQELTIKTLKNKFTMSEVPTHEYARAYGDSRIRLLKVTFRYVYSWLKYLFF